MKILMCVMLFLLLSCDEDPPQKPKPQLPSFKVKSFAVQYSGDLNLEFCERDVVYLDMYDYSKKDVLRCKKLGALMMGYTSSQFESWRPDSSKFKKKDLGKSLDGWPGEKWINTKSTAIRELMLERIIYAKGKGFDGIDIDNVDGYHFETGFDYSKKDAADYVNFFINTSKKLDMKFSLKNGMDLIPKILRPSMFQNEQCYQYNECKAYDGYIDKDTPLFIIRYKRKCPKQLYKNAFTILKKSMNEKDKICN